MTAIPSYSIIKTVKEEVLKQEGLQMKRLTLKNFEMAMNLIMAKGYTKLQANDIAINCFALASNFGGNVEQYIQKIDETTSAE